MFGRKRKWLHTLYLTLARLPVTNDSGILNGSDFLQNAGESAKSIRAVNWIDTPLGDPSEWPQSLRSALSICLNSNFPIAIYWGSELTLLYNDAWSPIPGDKHPWAQGRPAREVWPEIWEDIQPQFEKAFSGVAGGSKDALLPMQRHGYTEECYFDFTFTPIHGESGKVEGVFNAVIETTYRVINERRAFLLQRLTDALNAVGENDEVFAKTLDVLNGGQKDVPFFAVYEFGAGGDAHLRTASANFHPDSINWPVGDVRQGIAVQLDALSAYTDSVPSGAWQEPPAQGILVPLVQTDGVVFGCLLAGLSSRRRSDKDYRSFFESMAGIISGKLNTIRTLRQQRERAEALTQLDKAKTTFFSNISHEFRTPLTLMLSPLEAVLESGETSPEQTENLNTVRRNTLRLQKLVNTLLDFSRIEAGRMEAEFQNTDIAAITRDLASAFRSAIEGAGLTFDVNIDATPGVVALDTDMWEKVVLNLLSNAVKYTEQGSISVALKDHDDTIVLEVSDTGVGIPPAEQSKIFERFYRSATPRGRSQEGTGIGLALVKELVALHGGRISVHSEPGKGSTFTVALPKRDLQEKSERSIPKQGNGSLRKAFEEETYKWSATPEKFREVPRSNGEMPSVLVADDNADMREYISRLLNGLFRIIPAANGEEAFRLAMEFEPDLIVSDIMMPKLDGFGLLEKLKSTFATRNIPVLFLSARAGEEARIEGIEAGAHDYLVKPFSARELIARVNNLILINQTRRLAEKEFFNLFLQSPAHIHVMKGPDHVMEFFHPMGKPFIGGRDITGMKIREALPEVEGQGYFEMLDQVYHEGKSFFLPESRATFPDANGQIQEYFFNITYLPWRGLDGKIQGVLQFTIDVTSQVRNSILIRESEERFRLLVTSIPQIVWIADTQSNIEYLSEQWVKYTGLDTNEGRKRFSSMIHEVDVVEVRKRWRDALAETKPWHAEFRLRNINTNSYTWFAGHTVPLRDESGNVVKWIGSASDITAQKQLADSLSALVTERTSALNALNRSLEAKNYELSRAQSFLQTVLDSSIEMVTAFDKDLNFTFINKRAHDFVNVYTEDRIGRNVLDVHPGFKNTDDYQHLLRALKGDVVHVEARKLFGNTNVVLETFVLPLRHNQEITGVLKLQRDVTAIIRLTDDLKKLNSDLRRSNEDLQQFAHVTSHDLKEPVRKIRTYADLLRSGFEDQLPEKALTYISKIENSTKRIANMIDGILQYSSFNVIERGVEKVDLNELIRGILDDLEVLTSEKNARIEVSSLPVVQGSEVLLNQLFYNLINNSLKFSRSGVEPLLRVTSRTAADEELTANPEARAGRQYSCISISDNGIGFDQQYAEKIFDAFARLNAKDKFEGTGLGLALCKKIVERHEGFIRAHGKPDEGATFMIWLPV